MTDPATTGPATTGPVWQGPVAHGDRKLPGLVRLANRFDGHGRRLAFTSRIATTAAGAATEVAALGLGVAPSTLGQRPPQPGRGWEPLGPHRWVWSQHPGPELTVHPDDDTVRPGWVELTLRFDADDRRVLDDLLADDGRDAGGEVDARPVAPDLPDVEVVDLAHAIRAVRGRALLAVTGAGLSAAAGVRPFFGPSGLDRDLGLLEPFPGRVVTRIVSDPLGVADHLARWHLAFLRAEPTAAHRALADLERRGHLAGVFTTNIDRLHQAAGARRVAETLALRRARPPRGAGVIVAGSASDPAGTIARAREAGGQVVIIEAGPPAWARRGDLLLRGDPQELLPRLAAGLPGLRTPLSVLDGPAADAPGLLGELAHHAGGDAASRPPWDAVPDLADQVLRRSAARRSRVHGPRHWLTVGWLGASLAARDRRVDPLVAVLFGLFHDCARVNDGHDPDHGHRGADVASRLLADADWVAPEQLEQLVEACRWHTAGRRSDDPTIGACWDADRLDLWRVGVTPSGRFLSSPAAPTLTAWSQRFGEVGDDDVAWDDWRPLCAMAAELAAT